MKMGIPAKNSDPENVMLLGFRTETLNKLYKGKRLDEVARMLGKNADEAVIDLVLEDKFSIGAVFFLMDENNVRTIMKLPYVSVGSDAASMAQSEEFKNWGTHPRAYGTFARILGKYVREEKVLSLEEAIRKMTSLPATNLKISKRGLLKSGFYADVVVFNPSTITDLATFENPQLYAEGVYHVWINGKMVLANGVHTGTMPGRILYGPGWLEDN
jgi:N-acyl-D-amino-acid deacylase